MRHLYYMYDRFTDNAIKVIMRAQEETRRLGHNCVGTEQILLGLIGVSAGLAGRALKAHGINLRDARIEVEKIIGRGPGYVVVEIPFTARAKRVLDSSRDEADRLNETSIHTEHLLLGLLKDQLEREGVAMRVLDGMGVDPIAIGRTLDGMIRDRLEDEKTKVRTESNYVRPSDYGRLSHQTQTLYHLLQVDPHAEFRVLLEAYIYLVKKYHQDSETGDLVQFKRINHAWGILGDPELRTKYDTSLGFNGPYKNV